MINNEITKKKVFVETYGCQMNEYDSELVKAILEKKEYAFVKDEREADVVMLNTCAIRENAHRKIYGRVHQIRHERSGKPVMIGLLGCMATNLRQNLLNDRQLKIDFIAGPDSYKRLPDLISHAQETGEKTFDLTLSEFETYSDIFPKREGMINAWIAVMRGCNNFCTFCVVPYTRGRERSRTVANVVAESQQIANQGAKQITLLGQNVNSYHCDGQDFADLINAVSEIEGIERIRFTSPHPKDFPEKLLKTIAQNKKVCKHIHLPLQAGSNRILDLMNRTYTREEFLDLVNKIRDLISNVALTTDIIIGFPTETDAEFDETVDMMEKVRFDSAFIFKYSEREGTIAQRKYPDDIHDAIKTERIVKLNEIQKGIAHQKNLAHIGETLELLMERDATADDPFSKGRTDSNKLVHVQGSFPVGSFVKATITAASPQNLRGAALNKLLI